MVLSPEWAWVWRAWCALSGDRQWLVTMQMVAPPMGAPIFQSRPVPRPISWASVQAWADRHGLAPVERDDLLALIQAMDAEFMLISDDRGRQ